MPNIEDLFYEVPTTGVSHLDTFRVATWMLIREAYTVGGPLGEDLLRQTIEKLEAVADSLQDVPEGAMPIFKVPLDNENEIEDEEGDSAPQNVVLFDPNKPRK